MIKILLESQDNYMNAGSIIALSFFNGEYVDFQTSQTYLKRTSSVYDSVVAARYRILAGSLRNAEMSASIVEITTTADPVGEVIVPFILDTRKILLDPDVTNFVPNFTLSPYLYGGYCSTYDIQVINGIAFRIILMDPTIEEPYSHQSLRFSCLLGHHVQPLSSNDRFNNSCRYIHHRCQLRKCAPPYSPSTHCGHQSLLDLWTNGVFK